MYRATCLQANLLYIFCDKEIKCLKRKREFLRNCVVEQTKSKILHHAKEKNDFDLVGLASTNDLIAAEAKGDGTEGGGRDNGIELLVT